MTHDRQPPRPVVEQFALDPASIEPIAGGLINLSFAASSPDRGEVILQRVNAIFPPAIHADIDAVTRHLRAKGLVSPALLRTADNRPYLEHEGAIWRLLTRIAGTTTESLVSDDEAAEAGRVLGEFHAALADFTQPLASQRPGVHDLERHLGLLQRAFAANDAHPARGAVAEIAERIFALAAELKPLPDLPSRLVHGDPKISNVIFDRGRGVCLVDLDTITRIPAVLEIGDALRSWCNIAAEDSPAAQVSVDRFAAALGGYLRGAPGYLTPAEWRAVPDATLSIAIELGARFAADALNEVYFGWDRQRFGSASEHNQARAAAQLRLAETLLESLTDLRAVVMTDL